MASVSHVVRPNASATDVMNFVRRLYGFQVLSVKQLHGYDDLNFHIKVNLTEFDNSNITGPLCVSGYVVKVMNTQDSLINAPHVAGEIDLLKLLSSKKITCPQHVPDKNRQFFSMQEFPNESIQGVSKHMVRVLEYIEGETLKQEHITPKLLYSIGSFLGDIQTILQGYADDRLARYDYPFNYDYLPSFRQHLSLITDDQRRAIALELMDKWDTLQDTLKTLPSGIVYYDANEQNILVKKSNANEVELVGLIDFQDTTHGYCVYDIAICMVYMMLLPSDHPLDAGAYCLQGFLERRQLSTEELSVLYYCVCARYIISLMVGLLSYASTPDPYYLATQGSGWKVLEQLWAKPADNMLEYWLSAKFVMKN